MQYESYDHILQGDEATEDNAIQCAKNVAWNEIETTEQNIEHARHVRRVDDIEIYYDYAADYYFFCPAYGG